MTKFYAAGHALILKDGKYLLTRRSNRNGYMPLKWDLPGGTAKPGEKMEDTLRREIMEETALEVNIKKILYLYSNIDQIPERQTFQVVYFCEYIFGDVKLNPEEHDEYAWVDKKGIAQYDTIAYLKEFIVSDTFSSDVPE